MNKCKGIQELGRTLNLELLDKRLLSQGLDKSELCGKELKI